MAEIQVGVVLDGYTVRFLIKLSFIGQNWVRENFGFIGRKEEINFAQALSFLASFFQILIRKRNRDIILDNKFQEMNKVKEF